MNTKFARRHSKFDVNVGVFSCVCFQIMYVDDTDVRVAMSGSVVSAPKFMGVIRAFFSGGKQTCLVGYVF